MFQSPYRIKNLLLCPAPKKIEHYERLEGTAKAVPRSFPWTTGSEARDIKGTARFFFPLQLVQIKRTGENAWLEKNILPVSFAMLVQPSSKEKEVSLRK